MGAETGLFGFAAGMGDGDGDCLDLLAGEGEESIWGKGITPRFLRFARRPEGDDNTGEGVEALGKVAKGALGVTVSSVAGATEGNGAENGEETCSGEGSG